ncbi:hypothetical protein EZV62_018829 [Acer yangbiense]|uniref:Uncharacterized protein n=1 Tax=Acer yangbiense TaxID=1000413 RepID=A0A5C7H8W1_9ROSI|nr:hypothetical protein EZV62_018829 [Acer yangbiense]
MADIISFAGKVAGLLVVPIRKHILYPFKYKSNMEELKKQVEKLTIQREMVQHSVDEAKRQGDEIEKHVEKWMHSVDEFTNGVVKLIIDDQVEAVNLCSIGFFPDLMARYSLSWKASKTIEDGLGLLGEGSFEKVSYHDKLFDVVVVAEVTEVPDIKNIQGQIADELGLKFHEESLSGRAARLHDRLKKEKRVLLVLDNIWAKLDLEAVGIPLEEGRNDDQRQCKILLTSRSEVVLRNDMNTKKNFLVKTLSDKEAGNLFWQIVGHSEEKPGLDPIAVNSNGSISIMDLLKYATGWGLFEDVYTMEQGRNRLHTLIDILKASCVISSFTRLEELYMGNSFVQWDIEGLTNANLTELKQLSCLTTLEIHILDVHIMPQDLFFGKLERYKIFIGDVWDWFDELKGVNNVLYELDGEGFSQLKHLHVQNGLEFQYIINSVGFGPSTFFPKVESLFLHNLINLKKICHGQLATKSFGILRIVKVGKCDRLKHLFSFSMAKKLSKLQEIEVTNCKKLEEIVFKENHEQFQHDRISRIEFTQLHTLRLQCLPRFRSFGFKDFTPNTGSQEIIAEDELGGFMPSFSQNLKGLPNLTQFASGNSIEFPSLTQLSIQDCPKLKTFSFAVMTTDIKQQSEEVEEINCQDDIHPLFDQKIVLPILASMNLSAIHIQTIWHNHLQPMSSCFQKLTKLIVNDCDTVKYLFSSSMVIESLIQLEVLEISNCKFMEAVIITNGERISNNLFPKLYRLHLKHLSELTSFCNFARYSIVLPSLAELRLENCPKMHTFVQIPNLMFLRIGKMDNIRKIWYPQLTPDSFSKIDYFGVFDCHNLLNVFPSNMLGRLQKLEQLVVSDCKSLEMIFEELEISSCMVEENVKAVPKLVFPQLTLLKLVDLPILRIFYPRLCISRWPMLKTLRMWRCKKVEKLTSEFQSLQDAHGENQHQNFLIQQQLFMVDKVAFLNLEELSLEWNYIAKETLNGKFSGYSYKLKDLQLLDASKETALCPCFFLYTLPNLEKLTVIYGVLEDMFICDGLGCEGKYVEAPSKLNNLSLVGLNDSNLGENNALLCKIFQNLTTLEVSSCNKLKSLVSSSVSFQNLATLEVWKSDGLLNLMSPPKCSSSVTTASSKAGSVSTSSDSSCIFSESTNSPFFGPLLQSVNRWPVSPQLKQRAREDGPAVGGAPSGLAVPDGVQLQDLEIKNCAILEAIVVTEKERMMNTLFPNLKSLKLVNLPELTSFCNFVGNAIELLSLARLRIENCPNMQTFISNFTGADMSTTKDNLHSDIQPLFDEKLDKMDKLRKIWHHRLTSDSFSNIASFGVLNCHNLLNVFPSNMLGRLQELDKLWLINCNSLDEIFELQASTSGKTQAITATQLRKLVINDLPKLKHVWNVDSQGLLSFQNLISVEVLGCNSLKRIFPASFGRNLFHLEELWIEKCCMLEEIFAKEEKVDDVVPRFPQLTFLRLVELPRLRSFYPRVHISEWPTLKKLQVWKCDKIEIRASNVLSFQVTHGESQHEMPMGQSLILLDKIPFNNLESLALDWEWIEKEGLHEKLPVYACKLKFLTFRGIHKEQVVVRECPNMKTFSRGVLSAPKLCRLQLTEVAEGKGFWEGNLNTTIEHLFIEV